MPQSLGEIIEAANAERELQQNPEYIKIQEDAEGLDGPRPASRTAAPPKSRTLGDIIKEGESRKQAPTSPVTEESVAAGREAQLDEFKQEFKDVSALKPGAPKRAKKQNELVGRYYEFEAENETAFDNAKKQEEFVKESQFINKYVEESHPQRDEKVKDFVDRFQDWQSDSRARVLKYKLTKMGVVKPGDKVDWQSIRRGDEAMQRLGSTLVSSTAWMTGQGATADLLTRAANDLNEYNNLLDRDTVLGKKYGPLFGQIASSLINSTVSAVATGGLGGVAAIIAMDEFNVGMEETKDMDIGDRLQHGATRAVIGGGVTLAGGALAAKAGVASGETVVPFAGKVFRDLFTRSGLMKTATAAVIEGGEEGVQTLLTAIEDVHSGANPNAADNLFNDVVGATAVGAFVGGGVEHLQNVKLNSLKVSHLKDLTGGWLKRLKPGGRRVDTKAESDTTVLVTKSGTTIRKSDLNKELGALKALEQEIEAQRETGAAQELRQDTIEQKDVLAATKKEISELKDERERWVNGGLPKDHARVRNLDNRIKIVQDYQTETSGKIKENIDLQEKWAEEYDKTYKDERAYLDSELERLTKLHELPDVVQDFVDKADAVEAKAAASKTKTEAKATAPEVQRPVQGRRERTAVEKDLVVAARQKWTADPNSIRRAMRRVIDGVSPKKSDPDFIREENRTAELFLEDIDAAPKVQMSLFRGTTKTEFERGRSGKTYSMDLPKGFSPDQKTASEFDSGVMIELEAGVRADKLFSKSDGKENEFLTRGEFEIVSISDDASHVVLRQKPKTQKPIQGGVVTPEVQKFKQGEVPPKGESYATRDKQFDVLHDEVLRARQQEVKFVREFLGLDKVEARKAMATEENFKLAAEQGLAAKAVDLANLVVNGKDNKILNSVELAGLQTRYVNDMKEMLREKKYLKDNEGQLFNDDFDARVNRLNDKMDDIDLMTQAWIKSSSEAGAALQAQKRIYGERFSVEQAVIQARRYKAAPLTSEEIDVLNKAADEVYNTADRLSKLDKDDPGFDQADQDLFVAKAEYQATINNFKPGNKMLGFLEKYNGVRMAMTLAGDFVALGRQGQFHLGSNPLMSMGIAKDFFKVMGNYTGKQAEHKAFLIERGLRNMENYRVLTKKYGVRQLEAHTAYGDVESSALGRMQQSMSAVGGLPGKVIKPVGSFLQNYTPLPNFDISYRAWLNSLRMNMADKAYRQNKSLLSQPGGELEMQKIIDSVMHASGHTKSDIGPYGTIFMTAPRWFLSRLELAANAPRYLTVGAWQTLHGKKGAARFIARQYVNHALNMAWMQAAVTGVAAVMYGKDKVKYHLNPADPLYGYLEAGNRMYDLTGGTGFVVRQLVKGIRGAYESIHGPDKRRDADPGKSLGNTQISRASPAGRDLAFLFGSRTEPGSNKKLSLSEYLVRNTTWLSWQAVYDAAKDEGLSAASFTGVMEGLGSSGFAADKPKRRSGRNR